MIKVTCEVETKDDGATPAIKVHSHWNWTNLIEIEIDDKRYVIDGDELKTAIDNCRNTKRI